MAFPVSPPTLGIDTTRVDTTREYTLGSFHTDSSGTGWRYIKAGTALSANLLYQMAPSGSDQFVATATMSDNVSTTFKGLVPQVAIASGSFGWAAVSGPFTLTTAGAVAANAKIYTNTAGTVDDVSASHTLINGLICPTAIGSATTGTFIGCNEIGINLA